MRNNRRKRFKAAMFNAFAEDMIKKINTKNKKECMSYEIIISDSSMSEEDKLKARIMQENTRLHKFLFNRIIEACMPDSGVPRSRLRSILTINQELYDKAVDLFEELDFFDGNK